MNNKIITVKRLLIFWFVINVVCSLFVRSEILKSSSDNETLNSLSFGANQNNQKIDHSNIKICETMIIIDLSKNVVTKEVFDVSIKVFLKFILEYCNNFKYVITDDKFNECETSNGCNITVNICDAKNGCETIINNLDYNIITSNYSSELYVENLKNYAKFLNQTFSDIYPCQDNSVFLITNRIVNLNPDSGFIATLKNSNIKLTVILLDRNETSASTYLEAVYETIPNSRTLNFVNYDCLSYLFYCLLPCSNDAQKCMLEDVNDCQYRSKWTPNPNPRETLHAWYVLDFNLKGTSEIISAIIRNLYVGLNQLLYSKNIKRFRVRMVLSNTNITPSVEDLESTFHFATYPVSNSDNITNDYNHFNRRLNFIPWSGTLTETRIGILAVVILTNYATTDLITFKNGQNLLGQMFIYNSESFKYYNSEKLKNATNFHFYNLDRNDGIVLHSIQTGGISPTDDPQIITTMEHKKLELTNTPTKAVTQISQASKKYYHHFGASIVIFFIASMLFWI